MAPDNNTRDILEEQDYGEEILAFKNVQVLKSKL